MNLNASILLLIALIAANLPFMLNRILFVVKPAVGRKHVAWRLLELVLLYFVVGGLGMLLESRLGDVQSQHWEFYAITAALFIVFAYPGFVYRYLWRRRGA